MHHFLLANHISDAPRWQSAFTDGTLLQPTALPGTEAGTYWLHTAMADWQTTLKIANATTSRVVVLSTNPNGAEGKTALSLGAKGYAHAWALEQILQQIAIVVAHGGIWVDPDLMTRLIAATPNGLAEAITAELTQREWQVARLVGKGLANKVIAQSLDITERTVKAHLSSIFEKTNSKDRFQLALRVNATQ